MVVIIGKLSEFEAYLKDEKKIHKRVKVATPIHNRKVERVHRMDNERIYANRTFYSFKDANEQLQRYQRWGNSFPLLVLGRNHIFGSGRSFLSNV